MSTKAAELRQRILDLTAEYVHEAFPDRSFVAGVNTVPVSGKVIDASDVLAVVDSALDGWFTTGRFAIRGESPDTKLARDRALSEAATFGMLGLLNTDANAENAPVAGGVACGSGLGAAAMGSALPTRNCSSV